MMNLLDAIELENQEKKKGKINCTWFENGSECLKCSMLDICDIELE